MESPRNDPPTSQSASPDALDAPEMAVLEALASWSHELRAEKEALWRLSVPLYQENPPIDPSEGRRSIAEVLALLDILDGKPPTSPAGRTRAGYTLATQSAREGEPGVAPAFVSAFGLKNLRDLFPDLWAVDAALWDALDTPDDIRKLARSWLESPGRRLVQDIGILERMPEGTTIGATDCSPARIDAAIGLQHILQHVSAMDVHVSLRAHHEQQAAVPGQMFEVWEPKPEEENQQVERALRLLEEGSPFGLRGAALAWLLDRAADDPFYEVDQVRRDLREDLSMRLGTALRSWLDESPTNDISRQLETLTLQHAARFVVDDPPAHAARRGWAIARWLQGCLRRSPYFGGDEEVLAAHLRTRLPTTAAAIPPDADVLHPARFAVDGKGLDVAEVAFVSGVVLHYQRAREHTVQHPTPVPLVLALQRIASRLVRPSETAVQAVLDAGHNALGWCAAYSIMAPVAARRLLTELRIGWLAHVPEAAQREAIEHFGAEPRHHDWLSVAIHREGQHLKPTALSVAVDVYRSLLGTTRAEVHVLATFGTGVLAGFSEDELSGIVDVASNSEVAWRPFVVDALAEGAERLKNGSLWARAIDRLLEWMDDVTCDDKTRLNSALFAMRRVSASRIRNRDVLLRRIIARSDEQPFSTHADLQSELRRLRLVRPTAAGSGR